MAVLELDHLTVIRDGRTILDDLSLSVDAGDQWVILGANGSGKTTLVRIAAFYDHPSSGRVTLQGHELGRVDVRELRRQIGYASAALADQFRPGVTAAEAVMTAKFAALESWWHRYDDADRARADQLLAEMGLAGFGDRTLGTLSSGEQQRVFLARTLMNDPSIVLLDEPSARLDLGGREQLVVALAQMAERHSAPPTVLVTHHVDEIPATATHCLLLRDGRAVSQGPIDDALTATSLSECFEMMLHLERRPDGRLTAWAAHPDR